MRRFCQVTFLTLVVLLAPLIASAQAPGMVPLDEQVAIRHQYELRDGRIEFGPAMAFTLNRAFMDAFMVGLRAQYHFNEYLSLGTEWMFGVNYQSTLAGELEDTYKGKAENEDDCIGQDLPADQCYALKKSYFSRLKLMGDVRVNFTPFYGKLGIFSAIFLKYDFYVFGGMAFGMTENDTTVAQVDETNESFNLGIAWGVGLHFYVNNWISVGLELKDLMFMDNESGQDITRGREDAEQESCNAGGPCRLIDGADRSFLNHFFAGVNFTFFFPRKPTVAF
ncbi:MAG: outer membrane beta-barrel domain-containing protein [Deltaproteobacteria bacterium]|nr:outer membrane beta-barrel domain-containing protein [Deltaproteobacteria bacterium]